MTDTEKQIKYVGSCPHNIDEEFFHSDESTYMVLDGPTGVCVNITTCRECKATNLDTGRIVAIDDVPVDDFVNPFADVPASGVMTVVNLDGTTTVVDLSKEVV
jgi:hypothetical protein